MNHFHENLTMSMSFNIEVAPSLDAVSAAQWNLMAGAGTFHRPRLFWPIGWPTGALPRHFLQRETQAIGDYIDVPSQSAPLKRGNL
jgi:hypothetical protein